MVGSDRRRNRRLTGETGDKGGSFRAEIQEGEGEERELGASTRVQTTAPQSTSGSDHTGAEGEWG